MKQMVKSTSDMVMLVLLLFLILNGISANAVVVSKPAQVNKASAAVIKVENAIRVQNFDPATVQKLLDAASKENSKVKKLGKNYMKTYAALDKRIKAVANKIAQRRLAIKKAAADKVAADNLAKQKAAEKAAAEKAAATTPAALEIHGFYSGNTVYDSKAEKYLKGLTTVSFAWMKLDDVNGTPKLGANDGKHDFHFPSDSTSVLKFCSDNNINAQIAIYADGNVVKPIIAQQESRTLLIDNIMNSLSIDMSNGETYHFSGVVIDFEGFLQQDTKEYFNQFLKELKSRLIEKNKKLYVVVNVLENYPGYDYKEILKQADRVILMAHDYAPKEAITKTDVDKYINYNSADPIRSLAPIKKVQYALEELTGSISEKSDLKKIMLQISFGTAQWQFGIKSVGDWTSLSTSALGKYAYPTYEMIKNRIENTDKLGENFVYGYIDGLESPYLSYYNIGNATFNFILYEDGRSVTAKMKLAKTEGIGGISIWRLGTMPDFEVQSEEKVYLNVWETIIKEK